jgi:hypothetical protein
MTMVGRAHDVMEMRIFELRYFTSPTFSVRNSKGRRVPQSSAVSKQHLIPALFLVSALAAGAGWMLASRAGTSTDAAGKAVGPAQRGRDPGAMRELEAFARAVTNAQNTERSTHASVHARPSQASPEAAVTEVYDVPAILNIRRDEGGGEAELGAEFAPGAGQDSEVADQPSSPAHQAALYQGQSILEQQIHDEELEDRVGMAHGASNDVRVDPEAVLENVPRQPSF